MRPRRVSLPAEGTKGTPLPPVSSAKSRLIDSQGGLDVSRNEISQLASVLRQTQHRGKQLHPRVLDTVQRTPVGEVQPVFRTSPFRAETAKTPTGSLIRILFVDEGNCCRSVLAEAMLKSIIQKLQETGTNLEVEVESKSLGPAFLHQDERVARLAREAGLQLQPRHTRCFDEVQDMVSFDLILAMDKFDLEEVLREVSVLDTINPGGFYAAKVRQLGPFSAASTYFTPQRAPWALSGEGIQDPLYGNRGGQEEEASLWGTLRKLRLSCAGLAQFLVELQNRNGGSPYLKESLLHSLRCPLLGRSPLTMQNSVWEIPKKDDSWRPVWQAEPTGAQKYTIRKLNGKKFVVSKPSTPYQVSRGYWTELSNVENELRNWAELHGLEKGVMPTNNQLRSSGANQICNAIEYHGGYHAVANELGFVPANRHTNGYWTKTTLCQEVLEFAADSSGASGAAMPTVEDLVNAGRSDLRYAISKHGGAKKIAQILGLPLKKSRQKRDYQVSSRSSELNILEDLRTVLEAFCGQEMSQGKLPSRKSLLAAGHKDLVQDIQEAGGFRAVATQLGLDYLHHRKQTALS